MVLGVRVARPAQRRPVPRHQHPGHPRRDLLHGRRARRHREDHHRSPSSARSSASPGVDRVESTSQAGRLGRQRLVQLRHQPRQRAVRGVAARRADPEHAAARHPAAVHHQVRHHQHPRRPGRRRAARGSTRSSSTTSRTTPSSRSSSASPASPAPRVGGGKIARDRGEGRTATRSARAASASSTSSTRCAASNLLLPERQPAGRRPRLQRLRQHAGRRRRGRSSDVVVRPGARTARGAGRGAGARRRRRRGRGRHRRPDRDRPHQRPARRLPARAQAARARTRSRVVDAVRAALPKLRGVPAERQARDLVRPVELHPLGGQRARARGACRAACSRSLVILIFLVSLRATGIVAVAIPLSIVATFVLLYFTGQTLNVFTLGGLALGVGRLVDDSIVELENIHRHLALGQDRAQAVLAAAQEVAMPILVSTITTVVVFFPVLFLTGVARNLFMPLALTIAFALMMSFFVSRTVTPLLCLYWLKPAATATASRASARAHHAARSTRIDDAYARVAALGAAATALVTVVGDPRRSSRRRCSCKRCIGTEFFPETRRGAVQRHLQGADRHARRADRGGHRADRGGHPQGARADAKPATAARVHDDALRRRPARRAARRSSRRTPARTPGNVQVNLVPRTAAARSPTWRRPRRCAPRCATRCPGTQVYFFTGGIVKRILNFGSPAPIDVEILGYDLDDGRRRTPSGSCAKLRDARDADGQAAAHRRPDLARGELPRARRRRRSRRRPACSASPSSRSRRPCSRAWSATRSSRRSRSPTRRPATSTTSTCGSTTRTARTSSDLSRRLRAHAGGRRWCSLDTVAQVEARQRAGASSTASTCSASSTSPPTSRPGKDLGARQRRGAAACSTRCRRPTASRVQLGGQTAAQKKAFAGLVFAALMALALVYMVLASQFKSLLDPLVIMFSVPLGVTRRLRGALRSRGRRSA